MEFDHWGIPTSVPQANERWLERTRVHTTNPREHPAHVEFLRYETDSPVSEFRRTNPHIAFRVADLEGAIGDAEVLVAPHEIPGGIARLAFVKVGGVAVELMQWADPTYRGWFPE
jgi:catechol 2,3-dioxygenase-like lactoylglutathione lyase family enzyme